MARNPDEIKREGWLDTPDDFNEIELPSGVEKAKLGTEWYARERVYMNGRRVIEWYKRNSGGGPGGQGDAVFTTTEDVHRATKQAWDKDEEKTEDATKPPGGIPTKTINGAVFNWNPETRAYDIPTGQAPATTDQRPQTVPTNTTEPNIVTRQPDGSITTDPNPNYKPPDDTKYITAQDGTVYEVKPGQTPKPVIQGAKPGSTVSVNGGKTLLYVDQQGNTRPIWQSSDVNEAATYNPNTGQYEVVTKDANGRVTGVRAVPVEGQGQGQKKPGPALPTFVVGMSSDALRAYADQLNAAVTSGEMTTIERDKRWGEALQTAQNAVNEATVIQRDQESNLNARVNLATTKYQYEMDGLSNALSFVSKLNATLPEGSPLGGQAFAALLGMQAIARARSGIDAITPPNVSMQSAQGQQIANAATSATATTSSTISRLTSPNNAQAVAADRAAVQAALEAEQARAAAPQAPAPAAPAAAPRPAPVATAPTMAPLPAAPDPNVGQVGDPIQPPAINPATGEPTGLAPLPENGQFPQQTAPAPLLKPEPPTYGAPGMNVLPQPAPAAVPPSTVAPQTYPYLPGVVGPGGAGDAGDVSMAPPADDFAILAQYRQPQMTPPAAGPDMTNHPALLAEEARRTPPWRITPQRMQEMEAAGVDPSLIWSVPTAGRVA